MKDFVLLLITFVMSSENKSEQGRRRVSNVSNKGSEHEERKNLFKIILFSPQTYYIKVYDRH